jgi:hypothetical protein
MKLNENIEIEELGISIISLNMGKYLIDGEVININSYNEGVSVKDVNNVRPITEITYIKEYFNRENEKEILSFEEYSKEKEKLYKKSKIDYDGNRIFENLEDEYECKKFLRKWVPLNITKQAIGEPFIFETKKIKMETGNKFISSCFFSGTKSERSILYEYDRVKAVKEIVKDKFTQLGMVFKGDIGYNETKHKKIWGNSTHSCIEYVTAFGHFIFDKSWNISNSKIGTLENLIKSYNDDVEKINYIIETDYNLHFNYKPIDVDKLHKELENSLRLIRNLNVYKKSENGKSIIISSMFNLIKDIEAQINKN